MTSEERETLRALREAGAIIELHISNGMWISEAERTRPGQPWTFAGRFEDYRVQPCVMYRPRKDKNDG